MRLLVLKTLNNGIYFYDRFAFMLIPICSFSLSWSFQIFFHRSLIFTFWRSIPVYVNMSFLFCRFPPRLRRSIPPIPSRRIFVSLLSRGRKCATRLEPILVLGIILVGTSCRAGSTFLTVVGKPTKQRKCLTVQIIPRSNLITLKRDTLRGWDHESKMVTFLGSGNIFIIFKRITSTTVFPFFWVPDQTVKGKKILYWAIMALSPY